MWSSSTFWEFAQSYIATARLLSVLSALDLLFSVIFKACGTVSWLTARVDRSQPACVVLSDRSPPHCLTSRWASTAGRPKLLETSQSSRASESEREKEIRMCHKECVSKCESEMLCAYVCLGEICIKWDSVWPQTMTLFNWTETAWLSTFYATQVNLSA